MEVLVFKTDIKTNQKLNTIGSIFNEHPGIRIWSVDTDDIDNVLRIEAKNGLSEEEVLQMVTPFDIDCEVLNY